MEQPTESSGASPSAPPKRTTWGRRRIAQLLFAAGCFAVLVSILPNVPQERDIRLYVERPESITEVSLTFVNAEREPVRGTKFQFAPGSAQRVWTARVSLPEGRYRVESHVLRGPVGHEETHEIVVDSDDPIELRLR